MPYVDLKKMGEMLDEYRIPSQRSLVGKTRKECASLAKRLKYPVVLKIHSPDIIHKSDVGGIIAGINDEKELFAAYGKIIQNVKKNTKKARIEGILVQKMTKGHEVIIGVKRDPQFGHAIMFGLGGILVEIIKDVSFMVTPVDKRMALEMIKSIKAYKVLEGARGKEPANINALADIIVKTSRMVEKHKDIAELDFNPVIVNQKEAVVVDARMMVD